jgi:hypothetical protein
MGLQYTLKKLCSEDFEEGYIDENLESDSIIFFNKFSFSVCICKTACQNTLVEVCPVPNVYELRSGVSTKHKRHLLESD